MSGFRSLCHITVLSVTLFDCVLVFGQVIVDDASPRNASAQGSANPSDKKYSLTGSVVNSVTGEGIPRAQVTANGQFVTMTDSGGNFVFEGLTAGTYSLTAIKPGYLNRPLIRRQPGMYSMAEVGPDTHPAQVALDPNATILGRVTDSDGMPVSGLPVQCFRSEVLEGRKLWQPAGSASTDEDGEYRVSDLAAGTYLVVFGPGGSSLEAMVKAKKADAWYAASYFPAPADSKYSGIQITAGQHITVDRNVTPEPFYTVSGTINGPAGMTPLPQMQRRSSVVPGSGGATFPGPDRHSFTVMWVAKGDYLLHANEQSEGQMWSAYVPLHVAADIEGVQLVLTPSMPIPINIRVDRTKQVQANSPRIVTGFDRPGWPQLQASLRSQDGQQQYSSDFSRQNDPTSLSFQNVPPGKYEAEFRALGDLYVASARYGDADLLREPLVVGQSGGADAIELVLRDDGGKVKGTITGVDKAFKNGDVTLLLVPSDGPARRPSNAVLMPDTSEFRLSELRPGSYSLFAFDDISDLEYANPDALEPYLSHAAHIDVAADQEVTATVELIHRRGE